MRRIRRRKRQTRVASYIPPPPPAVLHRSKRDRDRDRRYRTRYGITLLDYEAIFEYQKGVCHLCGRPPKKVSLAVDHDHRVKGGGKTSVRGLLCPGRYFGCNRKLGGIDNVPWLKRVIDYLENPPAQTVLS